MKPWYSKSFHWQPLNRIRDYFGESIGIYFAFVGEFHMNPLYLIENVFIEQCLNKEKFITFPSNYRIPYDRIDSARSFGNISVFFGR